MSRQGQGKAKEEQFKEYYTARTTPWDLARPDFNLIDTVTKTPIEACSALNVGCGTGQDSIWLAQHGFLATGVDVSEIALEKARDNAFEAKAECTLLLHDFLEREVPGTPFGFVFDRGCFHLFDSHEVRKRFAERTAHHLEEGGLWLSIIGSADEPPRGPDPLAGPPRLSARDVVADVEPYFKILSLKASHFESDRSTPPRAWACLMRKRDKPADSK